jgi:hypothetical protein
VLGLLVGVEDPVAGLLRQVLPRPVDVDAHRHEDIPLVLPAPRRRPRGDRAVADRLRRVRDHQVFRDVVDAAEAVARRARALGRVRGKRLGVQDGLPRRILARAAVQHPQQVRQRGDAPDARPRRRRPPLLLERDGRREAVDLVDLRRLHLVEQPPRVRVDRLEVPPLRLGVERPERERRLARPGHAGEDDERVAWDADVDVLEVVLAGPADVDEAVVSVGLRRGGRGSVTRGYTAGVFVWPSLRGRGMMTVRRILAGRGG